MKAQLLTLYYLHPEYRLGGKIEDKQTDCSELLREAANKAGIPGTSTRTQAYVICKGIGAYKNVIVVGWETGDNEDCDIICQHFPDGLDRPFGINHILAIITWKGVYHIIHASSSAKTVVIRPFAAWVKDHMIKDGYRRWTVGEK